MTDILAIAINKREKLLAEVERLNAFIEQAQVLLNDSNPQGSQDVVAAAKKRLSTRERLSGSRLVDHTDASRGAGGESLGEATCRVARIAMRAKGAPMTISEILNAVRAHGIAVGGRDPKATLSARLSNSGEFQSHRGHGWWFKDQELPGYQQPFLEVGATEPSKEVTPTSDNQERGGD